MSQVVTFALIVLLAGFGILILARIVGLLQAAVESDNPSGWIFFGIFLFPTAILIGMAYAVSPRQKGTNLYRMGAIGAVLFALGVVSILVLPFLGAR